MNKFVIIIIDIVDLLLHSKKSTNITGRQVHLPNTVFGISVNVFVISVIFENQLVLQTQCLVFGLVAG